MDRLNKIASLVETKNVFDVGCDHGLLSIILSNNHNVVASDITKSSVDLALKNTKGYNVLVIQSDGLDKLDIKNDDTVILAGMGTSTILKILLKNINKVPNNLIIQSNNDLEYLRKNICKLGYFIDKEITLYEKRWYTIIRFKKGFRKYKYIDYLLGPNPSLEYIKFNLKNFTNTYNKIPNKYFIKKLKTYLIIKKLKKLINE